MGLMNYLISFNSWVFKNWIKKIRWSGGKYNSSIFLISAWRFFLLYTNDYEHVKLNRFMSQKPPWGHFPLGSPVLSIDNTFVRTSERNTWMISLEAFISEYNFVFPDLGGHCLLRVLPLGHSPTFSLSGGHFLWAVLAGIMQWAGEPHNDVSHWLLPPTPAYT